MNTYLRGVEGSFRRAPDEKKKPDTIPRTKSLATSRQLGLLRGGPYPGTATEVAKIPKHKEMKGKFQTGGRSLTFYSGSDRQVYINREEKDLRSSNKH